jgi:DNA-binding winged helix-turn-helix (wHTH) protein/tetratricopeptide (TPR) repeat protein
LRPDEASPDGYNPPTFMATEPSRKLFGPFEIRPDTGELLCDGRAVKLAPQPFQLLAVLVARHGTLVPREDLRLALWPDGTTVEFDQSLNFCIRQVRIALNDDARAPRYVETVPKRGYRFKAPVQDPQTADLPVSEPSLVTGPAAMRRLPWTAAFALIAVTVVSGGGWLWVRAGHAQSPRAAKASLLQAQADELAGSLELEKVQEAVRLSEQATALAPASATAWATLANAETVLAGWQNTTELLARAEGAARHALEMDPGSGVALAELGHVYWQQWRWREADNLFTRAIEADDAAAVTHQLYSLFLASTGRRDEALSHARRAVALAPASGLTHFSLAQVLLHTGQAEDAIEEAQHALLFARHYPLAFRVQLRANVLLGRAADALTALADERRFVPERRTEAWEPYALARMGRLDDARQLLAATSAPTRPLGHVAALAELGDVDAAFAALDASIRTHSAALIWLAVTPELARLHDDRRFADVLAGMGWHSGSSAPANPGLPWTAK